MWLGIGSVKGGAGSTTAALELAYAATRRRIGRRLRRVAVIDLDPQGSVTDTLEPRRRDPGAKDVLAPAEPLSLREVLVPTAWPRVLLAPAGREIGNRDFDLTPDRMHTLRMARDSGQIADMVDDIIIDLPHGTGRIAIAGMLAVQRLVIATRATTWGFQGAEEMTYSAHLVRKSGNPGMRISYIVSEFEETADSIRVIQAIRDRYGKLVCDPPIPRNPLVQESLESYHTPCRNFEDGVLAPVADGYQAIYDDLLEKESDHAG